MEQTQFVKSLIDFNKTSFENAFNTMVMIQDQAKMVYDTFLDQDSRRSKEVKQITTEWSEVYTKGQNDFKNAVGHGFKNFESFFLKPQAKPEKK